MGLRNVALGFVICSVILTVASCESDEKRLERLSSAKLMECLLAQADYRAVESAQVKLPPRDAYLDSGQVNALSPERRAAIRATGLDTLLEKWGKQKTKCELATRDYDLFMSGR